MLSLIIPCYNEGLKLTLNIQEVKGYLKEKGISEYEIIIVNDGSVDNTLQTLHRVEKEMDKVKVVSYDKNRGKGYAVKKGIEKSTGEWIIFMDADLSTKLTAIEEVLNKSKDDKYDVIIGSRRHKDTILSKPQNLPRKIVGKTCSLLTNIIIPLNIKDTQCGFKAFKGDFAREMISVQTLERFAFDVEYLYISKINNKKILEIPVVWENDEDSKVSVVKSSIKFFSDLLKLRKNKNIYKLKGGHKVD